MHSFFSLIIGLFIHSLTHSLTHAIIYSIDGLIPTTPLLGSIEFSDVTFAYPSRQDIPVFSHFNLQVSQGLVLAIVGGSGSGKSTLAALLLRLYDPNAGTTIDVIVIHLTLVIMELLVEVIIFLVYVVHLYLPC